jgi:membrane protein DedA with SNARE-associated domain
MQDIIAHFSSVAYEYRYFLVFLGTMVEGPVLMVACGFLVRLGFFSLAPIFLTLYLADLTADTVWYFIGRYFANPFMDKFGKFFGLSHNTIDKAGALFKKYHDRVIILSKVTIGFGLAIWVIVFAGMIKVPFRRYIILSGVGEILLIAMMLAFGYIFGHLYASIANGFKYFFLIGTIALVLGALYGVSRYLKSKIAHI